MNGQSFKKASDKARADALSTFGRIAAASVPEGVDWTYADVQRELEEELKELAKTRRQEEMKTVISGLRKTLDTKLSDHVMVLFLGEASAGTGPGSADAPPSPTKGAGTPEGLWGRVFEAYAKVLGTCKTTMERRLKEVFACEAPVVSASLAKLVDRAWELFFDKVRAEVSESRFVSRLRQRFEAKFRFGTDGLPKVWQPGEDIDGAFRVAKEHAESLIPVYATIVFPIQPDILPFDPVRCIEKAIVGILQCCRPRHLAACQFALCVNMPAS